MFGQIFTAILARELRALRRELEAYPSEESIWLVPPGIANSAGTLALHLIGNLRYLIGTNLGATGYMRDRDAEFATRNVSRADLVQGIDETITLVEKVLPAVGEDRMEEMYPIEVAGVRVRTDDFLAHLAVHLAYHLGQVDYHRRLLAAPGTVGAMAIPDLATAR
ncbi:MAG TPA: DUF1572 family protein, partial [Gemmatimonadaceae bacterium]|nr:DUF1572 family protein [Gemmatimonadaceae bacterium]